MRDICHILRAGSYATLLPWLSLMVDASFTNCMPRPEDRLIAVLMTVIAFYVISGCGAILNRKQRQSDVVFWASSAICHAVVAGLVFATGAMDCLARVRISFARFRHAFAPDYDPDLALGAVSGLTEAVLILWVPVGGLLSIIALLTVLCDSRRRPLPDA